MTIDYTKKIMVSMPKVMKSMSKTPEATHFFNLNDQAKKLTEDKAQMFHHLVSK